jgi:outer membrane protein TolC
LLALAWLSLPGLLPADTAGASRIAAQAPAAPADRNSPADPAAGDTGPLDLAACLRLADAHAAAIRTAAALADKAAADRDQAGARRWPKLDAKGGLAYLVNPPKGVTVARGALGTLPLATGTAYLPSSDMVVQPDAEHSYFQFSATVSWPILTWGKLDRAFELASLAFEAAGNELWRTKRDIARETTRAFNAAVLAEESVIVLEELAGIAGVMRGDRQKSLDEGEATKADVLAAMADEGRMAEQLVDARERLATARAMLGFLGGVDIEGRGLRPDTRTWPELDEGALLEAAWSNAEMAAVRIRQSQAQAQLGLARGGMSLLPDLALNVELSTAGQKIPIVDSKWPDTWNWDLIISLGINLNLFDAGASAAALRSAEAGLAAASAQAGSLREQMKVTVRQKLGAWRVAVARAASAAGRQALADERLRAVMASAELGLAKTQVLHQTQIARGSARLDRALADWQAREALADLGQLVQKELW